MLEHWPVPVTLDDKEQYLIVHAILMTLKQGVREEELVNITRNSKIGKGKVIPLMAQCGPDGE